MVPDNDSDFSRFLGEHAPKPGDDQESYLPPAGTAVSFVGIDSKGRIVSDTGGGLALIGDVNGPANANHVDSLSGPGAGAAVQGNTAIEWPGGAGTLPTVGTLRFPSMPAGAGNFYTAMTTYTAPGQVLSGAPRALSVISFVDNSGGNTSLQIGEPGMYFTILVGGENGAVGMSTGLSGTGQMANCYLGCRSDGLVFMNAAALGAPLSGMFERSDSIATDYALRDEYDYNGTTTIRFGPQVTTSQCRYFDGLNDRRIFETVVGTQTFGDALTTNVNLFGNVVTVGSALYGLLADNGQGYAALRINGVPTTQSNYPAANQHISGLAEQGVAGVAVVGANPGDYVVHIGAALTAPTANPVTGFLLYVDPADGILKARGSAGTITPIAIP